MTDNEIIKALEDMLKNFDGKVTDFMAISSAIDLINRQKAEIERLKYQVNRLKKYDEERDIALHSRLIATSKAEAVKEFAERLKDKITMSPHSFISIDKWYIDNLVKEMVGE